MQILQSIDKMCVNLKHMEQNAKYAIVKTKEFSMVYGDRHLDTIRIKLFKKDTWSGLNCITDTLLKNPKIVDNGRRIVITGERINFYPTLGKMWYGKRYELFNVKDEKGNNVKPEDAVALVKYFSAGKLDVTTHDLKIGYDGFLGFLRGKKIYYLDNTVDVISKLSFIEPKYIKKRRKNYYVDGWYQSTINTPFEITTNKYTIENAD